MDEEEFFDYVTKERSYKWDSVLEKKIEKGELDPWDLDLRILSGLCLKKLEEKNMGLDVSGKVLLVSSILLRIKAQLLGLELFEGEEQEEEEEPVEIGRKTEEEIKPKVPLPKKRKATLDDLVDSLQKAIEVEERRKERREKVEVSEEETKKEIEKSKPNEGVDIKTRIKEVFHKIKETIKEIGKKTVSFSKLVKGGKEEKVWTFVSLIYLANDGKVYLEQDKPFGEIEISYESEEV